MNIGSEYNTKDPNRTLRLTSYKFIASKANTLGFFCELQGP